MHFHTMKQIGKFGIDRGSFLTGGGTIITLRFKAERVGKTTVTVRNIEATNLEEEVRPKDASSSITVNPKATPTPPVTPTPTPMPTPNPTSTPTNPPVINPTPTQDNNQNNRRK